MMNVEAYAVNIIIVAISPLEGVYIISGMETMVPPPIHVAKKHECTSFSSAARTKWNYHGIKDKITK